jgi:hypothetical protein
LGRTPYFFKFIKGEEMKTISQPEAQEVHLQERAAEALTDDSRPAAQVLEEQSNDTEQNSSPCFIP